MLIIFGGFPAIFKESGYFTLLLSSCPIKSKFYIIPAEICQEKETGTSYASSLLSIRNSGYLDD
jgi:hypothetical protein